MALKRYPIGIQGFESLRNAGFYYVDKTQYIYQLATTSKVYFLRSISSVAPGDSGSPC